MNSYIKLLFVLFSLGHIFAQTTEELPIEKYKLIDSYTSQNMLNFRELPITPLLTIKSVEERKVKNINQNLSKLIFDSVNYPQLFDSIYFYGAPFYKKKYNLTQIDTTNLNKIVKDNLNKSSYFKAIKQKWSEDKLKEYLVFRYEYELVNYYFPNFKIDSFRNDPAYPKLLDRLTGIGVSQNKTDSILSLVTQIDYSPLHFYYKPNSIIEQIAVDKTDVSKIDFDPLVKFWQTNKIWLDSASQRYGVNPEIIVGILKKETNLGKVSLNYRLFEVLLGQLTASINNPSAPIETIKSEEKRVERLQKSAANSLYHAIQYALKNNYHPNEVKSNLVGAMGFPQFMPFNLRLAVDANGDGKADLNSMPDVIFSIANFLNEKGWKKNIPYNQKGFPQIHKYILTYNSNTSYATAVYEIAEGLYKLNHPEKKGKKRSKKKAKKKAKSKK